MKAIIATLFLISMVVGGGYLVLRLFSRVAGVDMAAAFGWAFKTKRLAIVLPMLLLHLIAAIFIMALFMLPFTSVSASRNSVGGLSGYVSGENFYTFYDVGDSSWREVIHYNPPPMPATVDRVPDVVSFYKAPGAEHYGNVEALNLPVLIVFLIFAAIGAVPQYFALIMLANEYRASAGPAEKISSASISNAFADLTGVRPWIVLAGFFVILAALITMGSIISGRILKGHRSQYGQVAEALHGQAVAALPPGTELTGRLAGKTVRYVKTYNEDLTNRKQPRRQSSTTFSIDVFAVELPDIADLPLYVAIEIPSSVEDDPQLIFLNGLIGQTEDTGGRSAGPGPEIPLLVNGNLTLSVAPEALAR